MKLLPDSSSADDTTMTTGFRRKPPRLAVASFNKDDDIVDFMVRILVEPVKKSRLSCELSAVKISHHFCESLTSQMKKHFMTCTRKESSDKNFSCGSAA
mmetsp:Transcript_33827/g.49863  ORF Transcript_33827/g.49863 Transcript_33827/m.49863 type:complete len:99 (-) Transcript_33827:47-343(-)